MRTPKPFGRGLRLPLVLAMVLAAAAAMTDPREADRVYVNGNIYTVDAAFSTASALAVMENGSFTRAFRRSGPRSANGRPSSACSASSSAAWRPARG